jgi:hypothetical protein
MKSGRVRCRIATGLRCDVTAGVAESRRFSADESPEYDGQSDSISESSNPPRFARYR